MPQFRKMLILAAVALLAFAATPAQARKKAPAVEAIDPIVFIDRPVTLRGDRLAQVDDVRYTVKLLTREGWGEPVTGTARTADGTISLEPLGEGIHAVTLFPESDKPIDARFLAMSPPAAADPARVREAMPTNREKLLAGQPFKVVAMGDSVTKTGDWPQMLAALLARGTGNEQIDLAVYAHPGKSIDATLRNWDRQVGSADPDLGLIMYGLNEQIVGGTLEIYLPQHRSVAKRLRALDADPVFMQPTTHIQLAERGEGNWAPADPLRTLRFGAALGDLGAELGVPVAPTFDAVWGRRVADPVESARELWPLYPQHYGKPYTTILDTDGQGDVIHPNALGHLAMAKAVYRTLTQSDRPTAPDGSTLWDGQLYLTGVTEWRDGRVVSKLTMTNRSDQRHSGRLRIDGPTDAQIDAPEDAYDLAPGESLTVEAVWSAVNEPADLLAYPHHRYLAAQTPRLDVTSMEDGGSSVAAPPAPWDHAARFIPGRWVAQDKTTTVRWEAQGQTHEQEVAFDSDEVGRLPLLREVKPGTWIGAHLDYVRFAGALPGEAAIDGKLDEWDGHVWRYLGAPAQAIWTRGPEDHRASPSDAEVWFTAKAGREALYIAIKARGNVIDDPFTFWFDTRTPDLLGTPGGYYWVWCNLQEEGKVRVRRGETSPRHVRGSGQWTQGPEGMTHIEISIPYAALQIDAFPASGDLGLSMLWEHRDEAQGKTSLQWSDRGHPWAPMRYGVLRLQETADGEALPYAVWVR